MEERNKKKERRSIKKMLGGFLALVLVAVVSIVGTLAYLEKTTGVTTNTFTGSDDLSLTVEEPNWTTVKDGASKSGSDLAKSYTPGLVIDKDPQLYNGTIAANGDKTAGKYDEWVAIRVDYCLGDSTKTQYTEFAKQTSETTNTVKVIEGISFKTSDWIEVTPVDDNATYQVFICKNKLGAGGTTASLFDTITINNKLEKGQSGYPKFNIYISGAAIRYEENLHANIADLTDIANASTGELFNIKTALLTLLNDAHVTVPPSS